MTHSFPTRRSSDLEGEYLGVIVSFEDTKSKSGNKMWVYGIQLKSDRRAVYPVYCVLDPKSLWKLRDVLVACGKKVPQKRLAIKGDVILNQAVGIFLEDDEYAGKPKSAIPSFLRSEVGRVGQECVRKLNSRG